VLAAADDPPARRVRAELHAQLARQLAETPPAAVARELAAEGRRRPVSPKGLAALSAFLAMRRRMARAARATPLPGYWSRYLELIEPPLREPVGAIYGEALAGAPAGTDAELFARTTSLARWIAAPLAEAA
jgi:hypothetical protein